MAAASSAKKSLVYANDGSGRDTFVNYAGAYWMNPLPAGIFFKSVPDAPGSATQKGGTMEFGDSNAHTGRSLFGKSRYGTTVLAADQAGLATTGSSVAAAARESGESGEGEEGFNGEATALSHTPFDVSRPEQRLRQPGHATTGLEGTNGGSTYNGIKGEWVAPHAVDNTLLRLAPTYESTCHYQLRTGRFFAEDAAPPHESTLPDKGVTWGKSRYY